MLMATVSALTTNGGCDCGGDGGDCGDAGSGRDGLLACRSIMVLHKSTKALTLHEPGVFMP